SPPPGGRRRPGARLRAATDGERRPAAAPFARPAGHLGIGSRPWQRGNRPCVSRLARSSRGGGISGAPGPAVFLGESLFIIRAGAAAGGLGIRPAPLHHISVHELKGALGSCARLVDEGRDLLPIRWPPAANLTGPEVRS